MKNLLSVLLGSFRSELLQLARARLFVALTVILAITFLFLVSLFGLTGSRAPTAIILEDHGPYAREFVEQLAAAHHSFDLRQMDQASALDALHRGELVAIITLPENFSYAIAHGEETTLLVSIDNVNTDMTDDIQRAVPSAIVAFGRQLRLPGIRVQVTEVDLITHDTGFIPYLVVSGLALDAFVIASIFSAMAVAREFEAGTIKLLAVAPVHPLLSILGRVLATATVASAAMVLPVALTIFGYNIRPLYPFEMVGVILLCVALFSCIGIAIGALLKRTLPVATLVFGISLPLYLISGSLEPQRFDGNLIWVLAHLSPVYYAVGILEHAFHGLQVTPEPIWVNFTVLLGWAVLMVLLSGLLIRTALIGKIVTQPREKERRFIPGGYWRWQNPRFVVPTTKWLLAGLLLLVMGVLIWSNQLHRMEVQPRQQPQNAVLVAAEQQRNTHLLNDYEERISFMLTHDNLLHSQATEPVRVTANELTQETLREVDPTHKAVLLHFLYDSKLIDDEFHIISLEGANFHAGRFAGLNLSDSVLSGANFSDADMRGIELRSATLTAVNLSGANLAGADLSGADLSNADVSNANLAGADLMGITGISLEQLIKAKSLAGTTLPDGSEQPPVENDSN